VSRVTSHAFRRPISQDAQEESEALSTTRILHIITRLILGGAQENTLLTCRGLHEHPDYDCHLVTGPPSAPRASC